MDICACIEKIDRNLAKDNVQPIIVDIQNKKDLDYLKKHYNVGSNVFITPADYCNEDEYPHIDELLDELCKENKNIFVSGISAFLKLQGEQALRSTLKDILNMSIQGHAIIFTFQCKMYLNFSDHRLKQRICIIDGVNDEMQSLVFSLPNLTLPNNATQVLGVHRIGDELEKASTDKVYIVTKKRKESFPNSIFYIVNLDDAYDVLVQYDSSTIELLKNYGTAEQWRFALDKFDGKKSWVDIINSEFGNWQTLDLIFSSYSSFDSNKKWLYYIGLKLYGAGDNWCLNKAIKNSSSINDFAKQIYLTLFDVSKNNPNFDKYYKIRKTVIAQLGNTNDEVINYCRIVQGKGIDAIYYLTDKTQKEKELIFVLFDRYADKYCPEDILHISELVYPDLYKYLMPYRFNNELFDCYFQQYKYQKIINRVLPEFEEIVTEQAVKREYNLYLKPRSSIIESIDRTCAQLYFVDAMGVEFLGYIVSVCKELNLMANISICSCELPSITSKNKDFTKLFENEELPIVNIKDIDDIKHHGKDNYDYRQTKLPIHLIKELEILREMLVKIKERLVDGTISKAIIISDHGASRLAVIRESESVWEMHSKGEHSGRCCLKTEVDSQPEYATDAGDFWALANYDRFKGSRKANVEVHGGATLEEVTIPIIELTYLSSTIGVYLLAIGDSSFSSDRIPVIEVSYRKKATVKLFTTIKLQNLSVCVEGKYYDAEACIDGFYIVEMPDIKRAKIYSADVYSSGNLIAQNLKFKVKKEGSGERDLL